jgi:response regulator RpfG family c-di-GMP phosphodiesterase
MLRATLPTCAILRLAPTLSVCRAARIVAKELAPKYGFDDEYVEHVFLFPPLHDIGKIGIPDSVLLKAGLLDAGEREVMKTHPRKGRQLIDNMLNDFGLESFRYLNILRKSRNIITKPWTEKVIPTTFAATKFLSNPASLR